MRVSFKYLWNGLFVAVFVFVAMVVSGIRLPKSLALQVGPVGQVTLNPRGGLQANGSDGIRFTINSNSASGNPNNAYAGADAVVYRNTYQYCCSAGGPMLNIGGTLYGQSGPATSSQTWDSIELLSSSGATSVGERTSATGNSNATLRYSINHNEQVYTVTRTVSYVYPNDYVTDSYSFVIPEGNTEPVKFYLGGDTAPGSSDSGYGIMLTSPVRSVISLNTSSHIMFGLREVSGSKAFDGATSQHYSAPYASVRNGGDIGFAVTESIHDAGLMMQWNLGSTPGTQTASFQQFATQQGTNLNASFASNTTNVNDPVLFNVSIVNTELTTVGGLGYTVSLPSGLVIGSEGLSNTCGGSLTATAGSNSVVLAGSSVSGGANCVASIPVVSSSAGTYAISGVNFSGLSGSLTNNVGSSSVTITNPALGSDLNQDGTEDSDQPNVYSYTSSVTEKTVVLVTDDACTVNSASSVSETSIPVRDEDYSYINGLMDFTLACGTPGFTSTIKQYYYNVPSSDLILRKYDPNTNTYSTIQEAVIEQTEISGNIVTIVTYDVTDGGELDTDGEVDGNITDPAGLASLSTEGSEGSSEDIPGAPATEEKAALLVKTGLNTLYLLMGAFIILCICAVLWAKKSTRSHESSN